MECETMSNSILPNDRSLDWKLLERFYQWLTEVGHSPLEGGTYCKNLAYFLEIFLIKVYLKENNVFVPMDAVTLKLIDDYLGYWYPMEAPFASAQDLKIQLTSFCLFTVFLRETSCYHGPVTELEHLDTTLCNTSRYLNRLKGWQTIVTEKSQDSHWTKQKQAWLEESW